MTSPAGTEAAVSAQAVLKLRILRLKMQYPRQEQIPPAQPKQLPLTITIIRAKYISLQGLHH